MRYLGIDYGSKNIGLALSDEDGTMGFPHGVLGNDARLLDELTGLIERENVKVIVIGDSRNYQGGENAIMEAAHGLADTLHQPTKLPVVFEPEMLTTQEARRDFEGVHQRKTGHMDASAAALILTSYLSHTTK